MISKRAWKAWFAALALAATSWGAQAQSFYEGFDGDVLPTGWLATNNSTRASTGNPWGVGPGITDADGNIVVDPYEGAGFAIANYTSVGSGSGTISNWLISPVITGLQNGDSFSFLTTTTPESAYPDRLEFRLSLGTGSSVGTSTTSVGTFTTTLLSINPSLAVAGYPETWTLYTVTLSGLSGPVDGRVALRYYVTAGGPSGANSNIIGVDGFQYTSIATAVPEPATAAMTLAGLCGLLGLRRLRRETQAA